MTARKRPHSSWVAAVGLVGARQPGTRWPPVPATSARKAGLAAAAAGAAPRRSTADRGIGDLGHGNARDRSRPGRDRDAPGRIHVMDEHVDVENRSSDGAMRGRPLQISDVDTHSVFRTRDSRPMLQDDTPGIHPT